MVSLSEINKAQSEKDKNRLQARIGLASNVVGLSAGTAGLISALKDPALRAKVGSTIKHKPQKISRKTKAIAGGALALQAANMGGDVIANRVLARSAKSDSVNKGESVTDCYQASTAQWPTVGHSLESVDKAYRRYDPEADRQRRLGLYSGLGALGAGAAGQAALRSYTTDVTHDGKKVRGIALKPGKGKRGAYLTAAALGSGALGIGAYKRGISERNNPWN